MKAFLTCLFLLLGLSAAVSAEQLTVEYLFEYPQVETINIEGEMFDRVVMNNVPNCGKAGQPALPADGAKILLPFGTEVSSIEIITDERISLGSNFYVEPVGKPIKLSADPGTVEPLTPDAAIYNSDQTYPATLYEKIGVYGFRGYQILSLKLQPVQFIPSEGELVYFPKLTVVVNTIESERSVELLRGFAEDETEIQARVDNPETAGSYAAGPVRGSKSYDLLIITTSSLAASFQPLKDYHDTTGITTEIHTTTEIGSSAPDDIRDYIRERYLNDGIQYVIIGADDDIIPAINLYVQSDDGYYPEIEYEMPADLYFACLDGTYNYDGDSYWGEPTDGEGGGDVDLVAEVYVGRASVGNSTEADRFVNKTLWYLTNQHSNLDKVVLVGEYLGFGGVADYANSYMDELVDGSSANGYTTIGIPSDQYTIDKLYDYDYPGNDWPQSELVTRINNGQHIVNHLGHGSPDYAMKLYNSDVLADLTNSDLCFVYSQTCLAGHFDGTDCWAETMNIKTDHGAFGVVMNARYGWGTNYSTDGPSQRFNREFWDAVFNSSENKMELGRANHDSKEDNLYRVDEDCMRWCYYELNLFGDPTVSIMGASGLAFSYPNGIPETVMPGQETTFDVVATGVGEGVPVSGTGQLHYSVDGSAYTSTAMSEIFTNHYQATIPAQSCGSQVEFYVSVDEATTGTHFDPDPSSPNRAFVATSVTVAFEDNCETAMGWTVSGDAVDGQWGRGVPVGGGDRGDPPTDFDGSGQCYLTDNVDDNSDVDDGTTILTSPAFDMLAGDGTIHYARWYSNSYGASPDEDVMYVYLSNDNGSNWTLVDSAGPTNQASGGWYENTFLCSDFLAPAEQMKLRFAVGDLGDGSVIEAGLDDIVVTVFECNINAPEITTKSLPNWTINQAYSQQLEATGGEGSLVWSDRDGDLTGTGLSLSSSGLLSGTPTSASYISFIARVTDDSLQFDDKTFGFIINPALAITTNSLPDWTEGVDYFRQLLSTGGTGAKTWSDKNNDLAGTGLTLAATGIISGTPTSPGPIGFTAEVSDVTGATDELLFNFTINGAVAITTTSPLPDATLDEPYSLELESSGGTGPISWIDKNGDLSGTGLTLSSAGLLSGTPNSGDTISVTAEISDSLGSADEKAFLLPVFQLLSISTDSLPDWTVDNAFSFQITAIGGVGTYTWSDKNGDLVGSGLNLSTVGLLSGTPTDTGLISFTVLVNDEGSKGSAEKALSLNVNPSVEILTTSLPDWTVGVTYSQQLNATGGTGSINWSDRDETLFGTGLTLSSTGLLSGSPILAEPISFTARAVDEAGDTKDRLLSFSINDVVTITTTSLPEITLGAAYSETLEATGGTGILNWTDKYGSLTGTGLALSVDGSLSGSPLNAGSISLTAVAADNCGAFDEQPLAIIVNEYLVITTISPPDWTIGQPYAEIIEASGGTGTKTWTDMYGDLEGSGLILDSEGNLAGTPLSEGVISFTAEVTDLGGGSDNSLFEFMINPAVSISTETLPDGIEDEAYSIQLDAEDGTGTLNWMDLYGDLDGTGLTLDSDGLLSGTPASDIDISFTAEVVDIAGSNDNKLFNIIITPAYICGDVNNDMEVNIFDITYLITWLYKGGPEPVVMESADVNHDGDTNIFDVTYLISSLYKDGPPPDCE